MHKPRLENNKVEACNKLVNGVNDQQSLIISTHSLNLLLRVRLNPML